MTRSELAAAAETSREGLSALRQACNAANYRFTTDIVRAAEQVLICVVEFLNDPSVHDSAL